MEANFRFVDLFSGIGGFHAVGGALGGECVYAVEIDIKASAIYERNWGMSALGDITLDANDHEVLVPEHDLLFAGFPCQPFSKSGAQRGMDEARGTLFWNIARILERRRPAAVVLENVRNLAGPRHVHEMAVIVETLRELGYRVSDKPAIFSPHLLPPWAGGRPQVRERVFITASYAGEDPNPWDLVAEPVAEARPVDGWNPQSWDLESDLPLDPDHSAPGCALSSPERLWIDAWDDFVTGMWEIREGRRLPGFPLWADSWQSSPQDPDDPTIPKWKADFLRKNVAFYESHTKFIDSWLSKWDVLGDAFPPSRRKFEWQAQDTPRLWDCVLHFRPSGIRAKRATYLPALVAITQTSIVGPRQRRLSPREAARLQGLPDWFDFGSQKPSETYKQLGNGVSVGAVWHILRRLVERDSDLLLTSAPRLVEAVQKSPASPDELLTEYGVRESVGSRN